MKAIYLFYAIFLMFASFFGLEIFIFFLFTIFITHLHLLLNWPKKLWPALILAPFWILDTIVQVYFDNILLAFFCMINVWTTLLLTIRNIFIKINVQ